jgi:hypothetical protein
MANLRGLPKELQKFYEKHDALREKYELEHQFNGYTERYYNLAKKHEAICDAIQSIAAAKKYKDKYTSLKERVMAIPCDYDEHGNLGHVRDALLSLRSDIARGDF